MMSKPKRIFTEERLQEFGKGFMFLALEALEKGDIETAKYWCKRNEETKFFIHDSYLYWVSRILSIIYERWGEDACVSVVKDSVRFASIESFYREKQKMIEEKGIGAWVECLVDTWRQHCGSFTVKEDDEKFIVEHKPCGAGGRLVDMQAYDGPLGFRRLKKADAHTWKKKNLPIYCSHCRWVHEIWPVYLYGEGAQLWVHASPFPEKPGDPCIHYVYKNPKKIPEKYYEQMGMKKSTGE